MNAQVAPSARAQSRVPSKECTHLHTKHTYNINVWNVVYTRVCGCCECALFSPTFLIEMICFCFVHYSPSSPTADVVRMSFCSFCHFHAMKWTDVRWINRMWWADECQDESRRNARTQSTMWMRARELWMFLFYWFIITESIYEILPMI